MLINTDIKIVVTNDGKENRAELKTNQETLVKDILISLKLGEGVITTALANYLEKKPKKLTENQFEKLFSKLKLNEL